MVITQCDRSYELLRDRINKLLLFYQLTLKADLQLQGGIKSESDQMFKRFPLASDSAFSTIEALVQLYKYLW